MGGADRASANVTLPVKPTDDRDLRRAVVPVRGDQAGYEMKKDDPAAPIARERCSLVGDLKPVITNTPGRNACRASKPGRGWFSAARFVLARFRSLAIAPGA